MSAIPAEPVESLSSARSQFGSGTCAWITPTGPCSVSMVRASGMFTSAAYQCGVFTGDPLAGVHEIDHGLGRMDRCPDRMFGNAERTGVRREAPCNLRQFRNRLKPQQVAGEDKD